MIREAVSIIIILSIAVLFLNPGDLAMPMSMVSMLSIGLIVAYLSLVAFMVKEKSSDEREMLHVLKAGRLSYLSGVAVLLCGIVVQTFNHNVDPWLVFAVCVMLLSKLIFRLYSEQKM